MILPCDTVSYFNKTLPCFHKGTWYILSEWDSSPVATAVEITMEWYSSPVATAVEITMEWDSFLRGNCLLEQQWNARTLGGMVCRRGSVARQSPNVPEAGMNGCNLQHMHPYVSTSHNVWCAWVLATTWLSLACCVKQIERRHWQLEGDGVDLSTSQSPLMQLLVK